VPQDRRTLDGPVRTLRVMRAVRLFPLVVAAFVAVAAAPAGAASLHGKTGRGLSVTVTTDKTGAAKRVVFHWWVHRCDRNRYRFNDLTLFAPSGAPPARIRGGNPYTVRYRGGIQARIVARASGHRLSIYRWQGSFAATATIRRRGRVLDRCHFRSQHWLASTPQIRVDMSGDGNHDILQGQSLHYATPATNFRVESDKHALVLFIDHFNYTLVIRVAEGHRLKRGHYRHASSIDNTRPGVDLSGNGRACPDGVGEFTITRAKIDRQGLVALAGSFLHRCRYYHGTARGTFSYRR
jgi:hypothetical protein